jgi:hypothetical protein
MTKGRLSVVVLLLLAAGMASTVFAQRPDSATMIAAQKEAMARFADMDGVWRGPAWILLDSGEKQNITQTERIGPMLDGSIKVMEGRGYDENGSVSFNALGIIHYDLRTKTYTLHSHAQGFAGDFTITPNAGGYVWEIPAGPMTIRYTATFKDGAWTEVGDRIFPGKDPIRFFEMNLTRVGDSDWPAAGAVPMK